MDLRAKILDAATSLYGETGFRGTTTRQIAQRAGVNEVTVFRHFGTKTALMREAIHCALANLPRVELPHEPSRPRDEILAWAHAHWAELWSCRAVIRPALGEMEERPELLPTEDSPPARAARELQAYLLALGDRGYIDRSVETGAATMLLLGALFGDVMSRDVLPTPYPADPAVAVERYVDLFLGAIGLDRRARPPIPSSP